MLDASNQTWIQSAMLRVTLIHMKSYEIQRYLHAWIIFCGLPEPNHQLRPHDLKVLVVGFSHKDGTIQTVGPSHATPRPMVAAFFVFLDFSPLIKGEKNEHASRCQKQMETCGKQE